MKSYKLIILRSSQVIQLSLAICTFALIVLQLTMVVAAVFKLDLGIHFADNLTFGIYG